MMPANTTSAFWKSPWRLDTSSATMSTAANALPAMMDHHEMKPPVSADPGRMALAAIAQQMPASSFHEGCMVPRPPVSAT
ncbi:hypothetical protein C1862_05025 [Eggerthella lenta]|uniref:Uncharacterized protein n=1 Tax=Eggerthella lenta TaxID=84112 RepID=A0A369N4X0_EGGLN|nr:hypothetical protein C1873_13595 [Eggerthella lenta]RDB81160.1 hypothetical protein C1871_14865 [Eggerthella lenta]RDB85106.1 hypothetical protein C1870_05355 [Eggerthella lenta]RDB88096.1 hypothetical protein C1869_09480 [Eggerthella lenta]RDC10769.1 hypothetical protein C1862_05025 [Eggerthella lenta]